MSQMPAALERLRYAVRTLPGVLAGYSEAESEQRPSPERWTMKEVVGHLIDSASNNHQRFVRAQFQDELVFPGYDQDEWMSVQRHQERPWLELVEQWRLMNLHLAHVMEGIPEAQRLRKRTRHNLHQIAWRAIPVDRPVTLQYFLEDYVGHLEHHLEQALL